jgi:hypothetical protein
MKVDKNGNRYTEIELGWDNKSNDRIRITEIKNEQTVRLSKIDPRGKVFPGPEPAITKIPELIETLIRIYIDNKNEK